MSKRLVFSAVALLAGLTLSPALARASHSPAPQKTNPSPQPGTASLRSNPTTPEKNQARPRSATSPASGTRRKPTAAASRAARSNTPR